MKKGKIIRNDDKEPIIRKHTRFILNNLLKSFEMREKTINLFKELRRKKQRKSKFARCINKVVFSNKMKYDFLKKLKDLNYSLNSKFEKKVDDKLYN